MTHIFGTMTHIFDTMTHIFGTVPIANSLKFLVKYKKKKYILGTLYIHALQPFLAVYHTHARGLIMRRFLKHGPILKSVVLSFVHMPGIPFQIIEHKLGKCSKGVLGVFSYQTSQAGLGNSILDTRIFIPPPLSVWPPHDTPFISKQDGLESYLNSQNKRKLNFTMAFAWKASNNHPVGRVSEFLTEQTITNMSAKSATRVE